MRRAKVKDHKSLERDTESQAIVNTDTVAYEKYMIEKNRVLQQRGEIEELRAEIATLKAMMLNK
mgnify:CR=1 FL=1|jgi:hypothetical protein|tara:strand:- start:1432 stop:1623 length:192 start_codon:yes stop_codon:yes gene_type:complete